MNSFAKSEAGSVNAVAIKTWAVKYIANLLDIPELQVDLDKPFSRFGLDSASTAAMAGELGQWLGLDIDPSVAYDHPTINKISNYLATHVVAIDVTE